MNMTRLIQSVLPAIALASLSLGVCTSAMGQNLLVDPGFEGTITADGAPFVGFWEGFSSDAGLVNPQSAFTTDMPRNGQQQLDLEIAGVANGFAGAFQDVLVPAGSLVEYSVYHKALLGSDGAGIEARMEFRDSVNDAEISRTANMTPGSLGSTYSLFSFQETVPAGADTVRFVYAIQSFGGIEDQNVLVDDASLTIVPEPATAALLGLGGLAMLRRRRA